MNSKKLPAQVSTTFLGAHCSSVFMPVPLLLVEETTLACLQPPANTENQDWQIVSSKLPPGVPAAPQADAGSL